MGLGIAVGFVFVAWLVQLLLATIIVRRTPPLSRLNPSQPVDWPKLSIIVPARDEAARIEAALASKLACAYPNLEIVAVNDRSRDETAAILDRMAAANPKLSVTHVDSLPDGWLGKLNAMAQGLARSDGDWILLSDADVHVEPGVLERLVAHAEEARLDFVAVFPKMESVNPLIDAALAGTLRVLMLAGRIWKANDDTSCIGVGVGAFNMVRRSALLRTNAFHELRMEIADDVALGALMKQAGARGRLFAGRNAVHLVWFDSLSAGARSSDKAGNMLGFVLWRPLLFAVLPPILDLGVPALALLQGGPLWILGAAVFVTATATHLLISQHFRAPLFGAVLWPLGHFVTSALMLRAGFLAWRRQGISWRDTFYSREVLEAGQRLDPATLRIKPRSDASS